MEGFLDTTNAAVCLKARRLLTSLPRLLRRRTPDRTRPRLLASANCSALSAWLSRPCASTKRRFKMPDGPTVIFIGGWGRTGSTLLARLLATSPGVANVGEIRYLWGSQGTPNAAAGPTGL